MSSPSKLQAFLWPAVFCLGIAFGFYSQLHFGLSSHAWGLHPLQPEYWYTIFTAPFVHGDVQHIFSNLIPFFICGVFIFYFFPGLAWRLMLWCWIVTGILMFFFARPSVHIGASAVLYAMCFFLMGIGFWISHKTLRIISFIMVFFYGSMVWGVLPLQAGISWDGHLSGLVAGILAGLVFRSKIAGLYPPAGRRWKRETAVEDEYGKFGAHHQN